MSFDNPNGIPHDQYEPEGYYGHHSGVPPADGYYPGDGHLVPASGNYYGPENTGGDMQDMHFTAADRERPYPHIPEPPTVAKMVVGGAAALFLTAGAATIYVDYRQTAIMSSEIRYDYYNDSPLFNNSGCLDDTPYTEDNIGTESVLSALEGKAEITANDPDMPPLKLKKEVGLLLNRMVADNQYTQQYLDDHDC